jgi:hypothetical protein
VLLLLLLVRFCPFGASSSSGSMHERPRGGGWAGDGEPAHSGTTCDLLVDGSSRRQGGERLDWTDGQRGPPPPRRAPNDAPHNSTLSDVRIPPYLRNADGESEEQRGDNTQWITPGQSVYSS